MAKVTIFAAPKAFSDPHINIIQRNAIQSWKELGPDVEVLLIGEEEGLKEAAADLGVRLLPDVERNDLGTPLVSSIFSLAREAASHEMLCYLNADIILLPNCLQLLDQILQLKEEFLLVGSRWNLKIEKPIDFSEDWVEHINARIDKEGILSDVTAMDYFIFPRQLFEEIPSFAIGRAGWDNWMIYFGIQQPWPVIDITASYRIVHQRHDYGHLPDGVAHYDLQESYENVSLGGGFRKAYDLLDVLYTYQGGRIRRKKLSLPRLLRKLERFVMPKEQQGWRWQITRILRKTRRRIS